MAGCDEPVPRGEPYRGGAAATAEGVETVRVRAWPEDQRAALIRARLIAAQALNGAGQEAEGATALLEAALAVYDAAPSDMMAAGLDPEVMEALRAALQTGGENPDGFAAVVAEADTSLGAIQARGAEAREVIGFLVRLCAETFDAGVASGQIRRPLDYQTSYGLAVLALETASGLDPEADRALITELRMLVMMWPAAGPVATSVPAPDAQMVEQFLRIRSALAG